MSGIVTITFSPCIDKSTRVPALIAEKKLRCCPPRFEPGGGGINVARAIYRLGGSALAVYPAGGYTGQHFNQLLAAEKIKTRVVPTLSETRENFIVFDESTRQQYRFGMPASPLQPAEWEALLHAIQSIEQFDFLVVSGSLPPKFPPDLFARLRQETQRCQAKLVVDSSGEALRQALRTGVYLIKPNLSELAALAGKDYLEGKAVQRTARSIIETGSCEVIVVSMGAGGAMLVTDREAEMVHPPPVQRRSTVGAGDSMVAGIVYSLQQHQSLREALRFGVACGTAATLNPGTELCHPDDVARILTCMAGHLESCFDYASPAD